VRTLILGTAGHIDHGKTALVRALTGTDTDRLPEEKRRGITIDLGFARLALDDGTIFGIVDVPGHEAFVKNMLAGATGVDVALLVVAADEGVMPQTREHAAILDLLGVRNGVVAITKSDLADDEWLALVEDDVQSLLAGTGLGGAAIVPVSARTGHGLDALKAALADAAGRAAERGGEDLLRLPIDRAFTVRGTGTVVTGTIWSGHVRDGDSVRVLPGGERYRVRGVQAHGEAREEAGAGERAAVALVGAERDEVPRGSVLVSGDAWQETTSLTVRVRLLRDAPGLGSGRRIRFHLGTAERIGRIVLRGGGELAAGDEGWARIRLESPVVARAGDRFVLRAFSPVTTIAGGVVHEPLPNARRRPRPADVELLDELASPDPVTAVSALLRLRSWEGVPLRQVPVLVAVQAGRVADAVHAAGARAIGECIIAGDVFDRARERVLAAVDAFHAGNPLREGIDREELRRALPPGAAAGLADDAIGSLIDEGVLRAAGARIARAAFEPSATPAQTAAIDALVAAVEAAGLEAPSADELPAEMRARGDFEELVHFAVRQGRIVLLPDDRVLAAPALADIIMRVRSAFDGREELTTTELKEALPVSRKFLIPVLEHLDRTGITARVGEVRRLA
jgi:selenocysteine-specific elongation factor